MKEKHEKGIYHVSVDELYLFGNTQKDLDMMKFFQDVTDNDKIPLTKERFFQFLTNISADPYVLEADYNTQNSLNRDIFHYDDWMAVTKSGVRNMFAPIGMNFQEQYDFKLPYNPYNNQIWTQPIRYEMSAKNPLLTFEKSVLLDYTQSTDIMVCLAKNVYNYANSVNISSEYFCNLYFPFLQKRGFTNLQSLSDASIELAQETSSQITNKSFLRKEESLKTYRKINWKRPIDSDLDYIENGICEYSITLRPSDFSHSLPMEMLFHNLHASELIPFIKYNPGNRRENMYRLYSKTISADGRKIPILDESLIMKLSRELGKNKQISIYIHGNIPIYINIHINSEIEISGTLPKSVTIDELNQDLVSSISPIINQINDILTPSGYTIRNFDGIHGFNTFKSLFTYRAVLPVESKVNLDKQLGYITTIFDVFNTDVSLGAIMQFKRVRNYREMDAKFTLIRKIYERTANYEAVIQGLIENFNMNEEDAITLFGEFRSQFQMLNQQIIENPGFPTKFQMRLLKNELVVDMSSISSPAYLDIVHLYIDTILRLSQKPKTVNIPTNQLKIFKTKSKGVDKSDIDHIDVVVAPIEADSKTYKPMRFVDSPSENVQEQSKEVSGALDFDDDFDYDYDENENENENENSVESEDEYYGGDGSDSDSDSDSDNDGNYKVNIDGMKIKNPTPFYKKMVEKDPVLYVTEENGKFPLYSKACPSSDKRQPVIITDKEKKRIDEKHPGSYGKALLHGSSEDNKHWYICPRYWCLKTNSSITEKDVKAGKCGAIIPRGAVRVPPGAYVYEFNHPTYHMKDNKYVQHVPGFLKTPNKKHPKGLCIPCCYGKEWNSKDQKGRREKCDYHDPDEPNISSDSKSKPARKKTENNSKTLSYVISAVSYPLPQNRWGFMPESLQLFFKTDSSTVIDPKNSALILPGESCLLRYGVENSNNQSFIACFAYYYAYKKNLPSVPTIDEMKEILIESITLDMFIQSHNGNLVSIFRPKIVEEDKYDFEKYTESDFYKTIELGDKTQKDYLEDTIASYENFQNFIRDNTSNIDHTYMWDFFCNRNPKLLLDGMNLVILQISDNDITERVQMICPSNAYSPVVYNPRKETVILVKQDVYYEPIHLYKQQDFIVVSKTNEIVYTFSRGDSLQHNKVLNPSLRKIQYTLNPGEDKKRSNYKEKSIFRNR